MILNKHTGKKFMHQKKTLLFKNAIIDIFKNWVQFVVLTILVLLSGIVFTLMWTTSQRMNQTIDDVVKLSNLHDAVFEEDFVAKSADTPLTGFDDHSINANYSQAAFSKMESDLSTKYASELAGKPFFTFDRRESRIFAKNINNIQYLFKLVAYAQSSSAMSATGFDKIGTKLNSIDNLIDHNKDAVISNNLLQAHDDYGVSGHKNDGTEKAGYYKVAVDTQFAKVNNLKVGDRICPTSANDNSLLCTPEELEPTNTSAVVMQIATTGYSADLSYPMLDETTVLPDNKVDGVIYVNSWMFGLDFKSDVANPDIKYWHQDTADKISMTSNSDREVSYNISYNKNLNIAQANKIVNKEAAKYFVMTAGNKGKLIYNWNDSDYRYHSRTSMIFLITSVYVSTLSIVLIVFMVICFAVMVLLIQKQIRYAVQKIATLKALGYSRLDIYSSYTAYPLMVGLIGGLLGWLIGTGIQDLPINAFQSYFMAPFFGFEWNGVAFAFSFIALTLVLAIITWICCFAIISQNYLKLQSQVQHVRFIQRFQWVLNHIDPRSTFRVRFNNAVFAKSIGKVSTTLVALFVGTALITMSIFAPKAVNDMMDKTYLDAMNVRAGETHYELPVWNNPLSIYHIYNLDDRLPSQQNVKNGDISVYDYEPFHYDQAIAGDFSGLMGFDDATYMASVGAANLPNSYWQLYDKNYLNGLDNIKLNSTINSMGAQSAGRIAIPEYGPAADCSKLDHKKWPSCSVSPDGFAEKYKVKNGKSGTIYYTISLGTDKNARKNEISDEFIKNHKELSADPWDASQPTHLEEMPINIIIKEGMLSRSPWFVRDRLMNGDLPYGDGFGVFPYNSITDQLGMYFNPILKQVDNRLVNKNIKIDAYGFDPLDKNRLVQLKDDNGRDLNQALLQAKPLASTGLDGQATKVYPVVINQAMARTLEIKDGDTLSIDPNSNTELINGKPMDPFSFSNAADNYKADVDYGSIDFADNPTFNKVNAKYPDLFKKYYSSDSESQFHVSRQMKMSSIKQSSNGMWVGDYGDNYAGAIYDETSGQYKSIDYLNPNLVDNGDFHQNSIYATNAAGQKIGDVNDNPIGYSGPRQGFYNSWGSELQTMAGKMIYGKLFGAQALGAQTPVQLKVIGVDDSYGNDKMYILNHNNYNATKAEEDQNYAEQILKFDRLKDYLTPIFLEQVNGIASNVNMSGLAPFSDVVMHYWQYNAASHQFNLNLNKFDNSGPLASDLAKIDTIQSGMYYQLPGVIRQAMNYMYPVYNAKFTKSMALDDVMSNIALFQKDGDYTRLTLGGGQEFGEHAAKNSVLYPQYGYGSLTYSATLYQEYAIMNNFISLIMVALYFFVAIALLICLMIIVFTANIIIQENKRMITTMKVLGYRSREIVQFVLGMYFPVIIIGLVCGILAGYFIFKSVLLGIARGGSQIVLPIPATWWIFLIIVVLIIAIYLLSLVGSYLTLRRTKPIDALKDL